MAVSARVVVITTWIGQNKLLQPTMFDRAEVQNYVKMFLKTRKNRKPLPSRGISSKLHSMQEQVADKYPRC